jgi:two-component system NtrC family sensor kinase
MSGEQLKKLFLPFVSGWKEGEGIGLGLATSRDIVERHGGSISAESGRKGSVFLILLPYKSKKGE